MRKNDDIIIKALCVMIVLTVIIALVMYIYDNKTKTQRQEEQQIVEEERQKKELEYSIVVNTNSLVSTQKWGGVSSESIAKGEAQGEAILVPTDFLDYSSQSGYIKDAYVSKKVNAEVKKSDILVLEFQAYTLEGSVELQVQIGTIYESVYLYTNKQSFYITVSDVASIDSVKFTVVSGFNKTVIDCISLINYHQNYDIHTLKTGAFFEDYYDNINIDASENIISKSTQMLKKDNILFSISVDSGALTSYEENLDGTVSQLDTIQGMGTVRDMAFTKNMDAIVITARQNGVYIIDVNEPSNMTMLSHYDTLEYATGLCIRDDYLFISSRHFGIEIVDISNLERPTFINCISSEGCEYQDCFVDDDKLYVGIYYDKRVDIFDISNANNPKKLSAIMLDGSGQGLYVENGILYAATALDSPTSNGALWNYGKGTGNGIEIYDVTDSQNPVRLSVIKTDSRMSVNTNDVWDIVVSEGYAYLSNMFGGMYIYNVSDPYDPQRVAVYNIIASMDSPLFKKQSIDGYLFPYDVNEETHGCVYHVTLDEGKLYIVTANMGIYRVNCECTLPETKNYHTTIIADNLETEIPQSQNYTISHYKNEGCIWAAAVTEEYYFLANGDAGIVVLDKNFKEIMQIKTETSVRDLKINDNIMYSAESEGGIGIYNIEKPSNIQQIGRFEVDPKKECITQLQLSSDNNFLLALASVNSYKLIDVSNPTEPTTADIEIEKQIGLMYYRTLCSGLVNDKYIGLAGSGYQCWYESTGSEINLVNKIENSLYSKSNGMTAVRDKCLAIYKNGYVYYDPLETNFSNRIKIEGVTFEGKCSSNGNIIVVSTSYSGKIQIVDVRNLDSPKLITELMINGNPDIAAFDDDTVIIPCRYYGLLKFVPSN